MHNLLTDVTIGGREFQTYAPPFSKDKGLKSLDFSLLSNTLVLMEHEYMRTVRTCLHER